MAQKSWRINNFFMNHNYRSIELNLRIGCPINCSYCPQSKFLKSDYGKNKTLSVDYLKRISSRTDKVLICAESSFFSESDLLNSAWSIARAKLVSEPSLSVQVLQRNGGG